LIEKQLKKQKRRGVRKRERGSGIRQDCRRKRRKNERRVSKNGGGSGVSSPNLAKDLLCLLEERGKTAKGGVG